MTADHRVAQRLAALAIPALLVAAGAEAQDRKAQEPPASAAKPAAPPSKPREAPIGHRQPRAADLPTTTPKDEFSKRLDEINRRLDRYMNICRGC
jgi:hypothetical protein